MNIINTQTAIQEISEVTDLIQKLGDTLREKLDKISENEDVLLTPKEVRDTLLLIGELTLITSDVSGSTLDIATMDATEEIKNLDGIDNGY